MITPYVIRRANLTLSLTPNLSLPRTLSPRPKPHPEQVNVSGELPYAALLRACYRVVHDASYLDWGLTSDYDAGVSMQPHPCASPLRLTLTATLRLSLRLPLAR